MIWVRGEAQPVTAGSAVIRVLAMPTLDLDAARLGHATHSTAH
jgi:hypothetical protein